MARKHISYKTKLASALLQMLRPNEAGQFEPVIPYDDAKKMTTDDIISLFHFDHGIHHAIEPIDEPWNLTPRFIPEHRTKTAKIDVPALAKSKRVQKKHAEHLARLHPSGEALEDGEDVERNQQTPRPRYRWPQDRKIQNRPFEKRRKVMS